MKQVLLKTVNLMKTYKEHHAVNDVSVTIEQGDIYGFIGKNGAGKTTFIRMLAGLIEQSSGAVEKKFSRVGAVIEGPVCYPYLSAKDNLSYYAIQQNVSDPKRIDEVLEFVGLGDTGKKPFKDFSLGMKQRLGIGLAILNKPDFLILDEPINGLDPQGIVAIREIIQRLNVEQHTTILISSHILTELSMVATRYGIIHEGRLIKELTQAELQETCQKTIALASSDDDLAFALLQTHGYRVERQGDQLSVREGRDKMDEMAALLFENGIYLTNYAYQEENLEDYYLSLVDGGNGHA